MKGLKRFGISLEGKLLEKFDRLIKKKGYNNRSKAISDLIRQELVKEEWRKGDEVAGAITFVYDHHKRELVERLLELQHNFGHIVISTQHVHLDHDNCLEIIAVKGKAEEVIKLADSIKATKGVKHTALSMSTTGKEI